MNWLRIVIPVLLVAGGLVSGSQLPRRDSSSSRPSYDAAKGSAKPTAHELFLARYCISCHSGAEKSGGLALDVFGKKAIGKHPEVWERVVRKLRARQMPPVSQPRPDERSYEAISSLLESALDRAASAHPDPGRTDSFRRLTVTEYQNAVRDLLALDIDGASLLPREPASNRFDNVTVGDLSPTLMDHYLSAAQKISRLAVGTPGRSPGGDTIRLPADRTQEEHVPGLPVGTRGGTLIPYTFPSTGEYEIAVRLSRDRNEEVEGLHEPHELVLLLDRDRVGLFTVRPPRGGEGHSQLDQHLMQRVRVTAGRHQLGVAFLKKGSSLAVTKRQPYQARFNLHRHPRLSPAVFQVSITGPFGVRGPADTPSRRRIFICRPKNAGQEAECARRILSHLMRRAYRRPVTAADLPTPMMLFRQARAGGTFDDGIETALSAILVSPNFLFHIERDPSGLPPKTAYLLGDVELASRLSFFIWSSIPDDELLVLAERKQLHRPEVLKAQTRRMLADPRAGRLVTNFGEQWLHLRNLDSATPDLRLFPDFDDNLRQALRQETELFFASVVREDRSVLDLLTADYTYLNERLARHYGIPHVNGSRFRRVSTGGTGERKRGGLLRQGSILTVTSYATRTSPVIRGKWVMEKLVGEPPPPPPGNVPALKDNTVAANLTVRERLAEHRANPACSSCHGYIDPVGFSLENYDAIGRWRNVEEGKRIDAKGGLLDSQCEGVTGLEGQLRKRPELFVRTLTENLLMFGLGRVVDDRDAPAIRKVVHQARAGDYRFSSLVAGIVNSVPFRMRRSQ
jgi:mono/diheme cytochrome c family protein